MTLTSSPPSTGDGEAIASDILQRLQNAWNAGDGAAFGASMAEDADFVTIRADHLRGRQAIVASHLHIFETFYKGSRNEISLESVRMLSDDIALVHARSVLHAPDGPLAGRHEAEMSLVLTPGQSAWQIASFHITLGSKPQA